MAIRLPTRSKYGNRKTEVDGIVFASAKEARRYEELKLLQRAGEIDHLVTHCAWPLKVNGKHIGRYTPDFGYLEGRQSVVEDVKGGHATKTEAYRLRAKLFRALYPHVELREV